jgi:uncharacterized membrane protein
MLFDGSNDILLFVSTLTATATSFFAVCSKVADPNTEASLFISREKGYYLRLTSTNQFAAYINLGVYSGIAVGATMAIVECIERAANDIDMGVNGTIVPKNTGTGWPARSTAAIGADPSITQLLNGRVAEMVFFGYAHSKTAAARIRRYLKAWHGIALA